MTPRLVEVSVTPGMASLMRITPFGQAIRASSRRLCRGLAHELGRFLPGGEQHGEVGLGGGQLALIDAGVAVHQGLEVSHAGGGHQQAGTGLAGMALRRCRR